MVSTQDASVTRERTFLPAILLGGLAFLSTCSVRILDVTRVRWLLVGDTATYYLAWEYFRKTPLMQWPLGSNPEYGKGLSSSIFLTDALPLIAILLKPLTRWIDGNFQYFGWWLLLCFILQAFFVLKVLSQLEVPQVARLAVLPLFLFQPALLDRMSFDGYGHLALSAQWIIFAGIWLFNRPNTTATEWTFLTVLVIGLNFYYFVIIFVMNFIVA
jgi:hypothetical protein